MYNSNVKYKITLQGVSYTGIPCTIFVIFCKSINYSEIFKNVLKNKMIKDKDKIQHNAREL